MALCEKSFWMRSGMFLFILPTISAFAQEGYPPEAVKIQYEMGKRAFIKNSTCFPVTVFVNAKDFQVSPMSETGIDRDQWGSWNWHPGRIGSMNEKSVLAPLKTKQAVDFGPNTGDTHQDQFTFSYDFTVPEGTSVYAMESGTVARIVQHYQMAHQDKNRLQEVNKVEVLHTDGSVADYVHLKPGSVVLKLCDKVESGQLIGQSGHNGFSSGPHLHVDIQRPIENGKFHTIPLRFLSK